MASEIPINRKSQWDARGNIKFKDWIKAANKLNIPITRPNSGSSHYALRIPGTDVNSILGLDSFIVNIYEGMSKQVSGDVIKCIMHRAGISEDDIWSALGMLK